jgi:hypothetical protein
MVGLSEKPGSFVQLFDVSQPREARLRCGRLGGRRRRPLSRSDASPILRRHRSDSDDGQLAGNECDEKAEGFVHKSVGMQANSEHVHTEPRKTRHHIAKHGQQGDSTLSSISAPASVKNDRVRKDNRKRAVLLRIPAPKAPPRLIGPDSAKNR